MISSILLASLVAYAQVSNRTVQTYRTVRDERYAGDGAIKAAVNWARNNPNVGIDNLGGSPDPCLYQVETEGSGVVTVSCGAEDGSGSGLQENPGLVPPEAILALGRRHNQAPAYNSADCTGWLEDVAAPFTWFFTGAGNMNPTATDASKWQENSIKFRRRQGVGTNLFGVLPGANCNSDYNRGDVNQVQFNVEGKLVAAGRIQNDYGTLGVVDAQNDTLNTADWIKARDQEGSNPYGSPGARPAGRDAAGTFEDTDPARKVKSPGDNKPTVNPVGDIRNEWFPVGYSDTGTKANVLTDRDGNDLPLRTHAYVLDPASGVLTPATTDGTPTGTRACVGPRSKPIVFLPGWYRDVRVLNDYTGNPATSCSDRTFWFAPDAARVVGGTLQIDLNDSKTDVDRSRTGAFYFDFRQSTASQTCGDLPAESAAVGSGINNVDSAKFRWCIGNSASQSPRVVAGWPTGWSPTGDGATDPGNGTGASTLDITMSTAEVDKAQWTVVGQLGFDQLGTWNNLAGGQVGGDGSSASWKPSCLPLIGCVWFFGERSMTFKSLTPKVTAGPLEESGADNGRIYVSFRYAYKNAARLPSTKLEIRAKALGVADKLCASVDLPKTGHDHSASFASGAMGDAFTYKVDGATAKKIADECGSVDQINGLFIHYKLGGQTVNWSADQPEIFLDGTKVEYKGFGGASFPAPSGAGGTSTDVAARSDCDPEKPGAQFIFGGQSHVYVADGSMEVCAGPYPSAPADHQQIGIYQMPAVQPLRPEAVSSGGGGSDLQPNVDGTSFDDAREIGEPTGRKQLRFKWGKHTQWANPFVCCYTVHEARTNLQMQGYEAPAGYQVKRIEARMAYNPNARANYLSWASAGAESTQLRTSRGSLNVTPLWDKVLSAQNSDKFILFERGKANPLLTPEDLSGAAAAPRTITWAARRPCPDGLWSGIWEGFLGLFDGRDCPGTNDLDGVEFDITLEPSVANAGRPVLLPASGCTTAYPNYGVGAGLPDCAVLRSNANVAGQLPTTVWAGSTQKATWNGRFSVKGTVYTPSSAVEIDEIDYAYPAATRGMVVRHLRVSGWVKRAGYTGPAVTDGWAEPVAIPRDATFVACTQASSRRAAKEPCSKADGDRVLTRAGVTFEVDADLNTASVAKVAWWSTER